MSQYGFPQFQISFAGMSWTGAMAPGVSSITAIDSSFNGDEFLTYAHDAFLRVQRAKETGNLDEVRPLVSETIWPTFKATLAKKGPKIASLEHATIYDARRDNAWDSVTVRFAAKTEARKKNDLVEDWTFQRPAVTGQQQLPHECPSCGAPLSLDDNGSCRYCRVHVTGARGGWKLVRAVPPPAAPKVSSGRSWVAAWVIFMVLMTVVLPLGIMFAVAKSTDDAFDSFGIFGSGTSLENGPSAQSGVNEKVGIPSKTGSGVQGQATFSGGINGSLDGITVTTGGETGSCASRAPKVTGLTFVLTQNAKVITVTMALPAGTKGPGTYDLATTPMTINVAGTDGTASQTWGPGPMSTVTFTLGADDSGSLAFANLVPLAGGGGDFAKPLSGTVTFACA